MLQVHHPFVSGQGADRLEYAREIVRGEARALEAVAERLGDEFLQAVDLFYRCPGRVAVTGTNPRPVLLDGTDALAGGALDRRVLDGIDALCRDQLMSMKTTFTPGMYRRRVATVMAKRLASRLWDEAQR